MTSGDIYCDCDFEMVSTMTKVIEFYAPDNFRKPSQQWVLRSSAGRSFQFQQQARLPL